MDKIVEHSEAFREQNALLQSITGIGPQVARTLIAYLPELGHRTRQSITALVGLAPFNDDSGQHAGQRHIRGDAARCAAASIRPPSAPSAIARTCEPSTPT